MGFRGTQDKTFLSAGYRICFKILAGFAIQKSAGYRIVPKIIAGHGIGHKIIAGYGIQYLAVVCFREWSIFTLLQNVKRQN